MANIFLAIAVDKLLEVNEVEKDITKRVEQMEEQRREREKQLTALKNPTEQTGIGRTLKKIVMLYTLSVSHEEDIKRRKRNQRRRSGSEISHDRPKSTSAITNSERRKSSFERAISDPTKYISDESDSGGDHQRSSISSISDRLFPRLVSLNNPLRKAEESIELQGYKLREHGDGRIGSRRLDNTNSFISISDDFEEFDFFGKNRPSITTNNSDQSTYTYTESCEGSDDTIEYSKTQPSGFTKTPFYKQSSFDSDCSSITVSTDSSGSSIRQVRSSPIMKNFSVPKPILVPGNSPILKPGTTPMVVPNTVGGATTEDASINRLARQSSLEEVDTSIDQLSDERQEVDIVKQLKKADRRKKVNGGMEEWGNERMKERMGEWKNE